MQIYTVHTKPRAPSFLLGKGEAEKTVFVKEGFCWMAALFTVFWACWNHMWRHGAMLVVAALVLYFIFGGTGVAASLQILVVLGALLVVGFEGNNWRREELEKKEYALIAVVAGKNRDAAVFRYLKNTTVTTPGDDQRRDRPATA